MELGGVPTLTEQAETRSSLWVVFRYLVPFYRKTSMSGKYFLDKGLRGLKLRVKFDRKTVPHPSLKPLATIYIESGGGPPLSRIKDLG